ncbi:hypothetical protein ACFZAR_32360 [Streptomyces sp. NPDC008222]|uniref:hypothetical protein n=1 Tax=Streptomyces sp. NPDC008222 TaxID=3364820 RepID=UPI0036E7ECBE
MQSFLVAVASIPVLLIIFGAAAAALDPLRRRIRARRHQYAQRLSERLFDEARRVLPCVLPGRPEPTANIPLCLVRWWDAFLALTPGRLVMLLLVVLLFHGAADLPSGTEYKDDGAPLDPFTHLAKGVWEAVSWTARKLADLPSVWTEIHEQPGSVIAPLSPVITILAIFTAGWLVAPGLTAFGRWDGPDATRPAAAVSKQTIERRYGPVAVLLSTATRCGRAYVRTAETSPLDMPQVSVRACERAIRRAWRTRHGKPRRHRRRELKLHAAKVVGALRAAEAQQDIDPGPALQKLAGMLVTITERYVEGRIGELLDASELSGIDPVTDHGMPRIAGAGGVVVLAMWGAHLLGFPEGVAGPFLGLVVTGAVALFFRRTIPSPSDFLDILRSADRK